MEDQHNRCLNVVGVPPHPQYLPHDHDDKFHHNLVENVEKFNHQSGPLSHLAHADAKCNKKTNQTCEEKSHNCESLTMKVDRRGNWNQTKPFYDCQTL